MEAIERQAIVDEEQLRPLPVCYWVLGATSAMMSLYGLFYIAMGVMFSTIPFEQASGPAEAPPPGMFMILFGGMGLAFLLMFGTLATLQILTGFWIRKRRRRIACLVTAGISCVFIPFGTLIGVLTFLVLLRPSVKMLFERPRGGVQAAEPVPEVQAG